MGDLNITDYAVTDINEKFVVLNKGKKFSSADKYIIIDSSSLTDLQINLVASVQDNVDAAQLAETNAGLVLVATEAVRDEVVVLKSNIETIENDIGIIQTDVTNKLAQVNDVLTSVTTKELAVSDNVLLAQKWAEEDEDVEVTTGTYSAKHWAAKAAANATSSNFADLTNKADGTGTYATTGSLIAHKGSGSICLVANDGYGNANIGFNHYYGTPDQDGNAGRIEVNVDATTGAYFRFTLKSGVTQDVAGALEETLTFNENDITYKYNTMYHAGNVHANFDLEAGTFTGTAVTTRVENFVIAPSGYAATYDDGSRGPLFIWNNVDPADIPAGTNAGIQVVIGANPQATPGIGDVVAQTITIDNLNSRANIWAMNILALQNASGTDGIVRGIELEVANVMSAADDPFSNSNVRKHGIVLQGHSGSVYSPSSALNIVANGATEDKFWAVGIGISRCKLAGIKFVADPFGGTDTDNAFQTAALYDASNSANVIKVDGSHSNIIDFSSITSMGVFIKGQAAAATTLVCRNYADYDFTFAISSGNSTTKSAIISFRDGATEKWRMVKNGGNDFAFFNVNTNKSSIHITTGGDKVTLAGALYWSPTASETPTAVGQLTIEKTSNTLLTFKLMGTDSTVRSGTLTLTT